MFPAKWRKFFTLFGVTLPLTPRGLSAFTVDLTTVSRALYRRHSYLAVPNSLKEKVPFIPKSDSFSSSPLSCFLTR
jgi:hypothetical protein